MLNPDGVVVGNQRVNLSGADLNRRWHEPSKARPVPTGRRLQPTPTRPPRTPDTPTSKVLHPTVYAAKSMMKQLQGDRELFFFSDLHGHSKKRGVFLYGNCSNAATQAQRLGERMLPWLMHQASEGAFDYNGCKFKVEPSKECTARVVVAHELKVALSYTVEASYAGPAAGPHRDTHFTTRQLCAQGELLGLTLLRLCDVATLRRTFEELLQASSRPRPTSSDLVRPRSRPIASYL